MNGQPFIIENKTGAGGSIGTDYAAKAPPDGYMLLAMSASHAVGPGLHKNLAWNPLRDSRQPRASASCPM
jgi:tripartite-type tricarboxylate transporter receptor subunit TctC